MADKTIGGCVWTPCLDAFCRCDWIKNLYGLRSYVHLFGNYVDHQGREASTIMSSGFLFHETLKPGCCRGDHHRAASFGKEKNLSRKSWNSKVGTASKNEKKNKNRVSYELVWRWPVPWICIFFLHPLKYGIKLVMITRQVPLQSIYGPRGFILWF